MKQPPKMMQSSTGIDKETKQEKANPDMKVNDGSYFIKYKEHVYTCQKQRSNIHSLVTSLSKSLLNTSFSMNRGGFFWFRSIHSIFRWCV